MLLIACIKWVRWNPKVANKWLEFMLRIRGVPYSNLVPNTSYTIWVFLWVSVVPAHKSQNCALNLVTTGSFHVVSSSFIMGRFSFRAATLNMQETYNSLQYTTCVWSMERNTRTIICDWLYNRFVFTVKTHQGQTVRNALAALSEICSLSFEYICTVILNLDIPGSE
jgi:hypothetical protein